MDARVKWVEGRTFIAESSSGHAVVIDGPKSAGGRDLGPSPMELVLLGAGGCSIFDVLSILQKSRQAVEDCVLEMKAERAETAPRVFTRIDMHFAVTGKDLKPALVERAVRLSLEKYCSATAMLGRTAEIGHTWAIEERDS